MWTKQKFWSQHPEWKSYLFRIWKRLQDYPSNCQRLLPWPRMLISKLKLVQCLTRLWLLFDLMLHLIIYNVRVMSMTFLKNKNSELLYFLFSFLYYISLTKFSWNHFHEKFRDSIDFTKKWLFQFRQRVLVIMCIPWTRMHRFLLILIRFSFFSAKFCSPHPSFFPWNCWKKNWNKIFSFFFRARM